MNKETIVNELITLTERNGLVSTLYATFGKSVKVGIPLSQKTLDTDVDTIDFSVRACNALKRTGLMQVEAVADAIAEERDDIKVGKINVDDEMELAGKFGVTSIPSLFVVKNGEITATKVGFAPKDAILSMIN